MGVREWSKVGFLRFITAGLKCSKKWRDGERREIWGDDAVRFLSVIVS